MLKRFLGKFGGQLAIDLGTANTLVGVPGEGVVLDEPSVVAVERGTHRILSGGCAVGHLARQMLGRTPESIDVVHPLREGVITDFELCEAMLRYFIRKARRAAPWSRPRVVIGVPGCITPVEKRAIFNSAQRAGAGEVLLLPEAKAAAIGSGLPIAEPVASMVCDVGGGTTEVAVMSLGEVVSGRSIRVGGDHMDLAVVDYLKHHYSLDVGLSTAEELKIDVGSAYPLAEEQVAEVRGRDAISNLPRRATITSEEVRHALAEPLHEIVAAVKETLNGCGPELAADLVDAGLVLCGGGALLRGLDRFIEQQTGLPARVAPEASTSVARGALICLQDLPKWRSTLESSDDEI